MEPGKLKILVADDHGVVRNGVIKSLQVSFPHAEFGEAANAVEIARLFHEVEWDLVILDISMPGRNGLEVLKEIKASHPKIPIIIFSMYPEDQFAVRTIKAGASAYITKDVSSNELSEVVRRILNDGTYLTPKIAELIINGLRNDNEVTSHKALSDREFEVFLLIASGMNVSSIAIDLSLSVKTISVYRSNILKKMNLKNNSEITHYAFKQNLVE